MPEWKMVKKYWLQENMQKKLKLANGQERFVSHPIRSLAQAYVYRNQCQPFAVNMDRINAVYIYDGKDTWTDESGVEWNKAVK